MLHTGKFLALIREGHWEYVDWVKASGAAIIIAVNQACSQRAACRILRLARSAFRYRGRTPTLKEDQLRKRLLKLSKKHPRLRSIREAFSPCQSRLLFFIEKRGFRPDGQSLQFPLADAMVSRLLCV